jgi:hypothetical protein
VAFIGVSAEPQAIVAKFIREMKIPWPSLCEVSDDALAGLGAHGFEEGRTIPVLYIVSAEGTIVWSDARARTGHEPADQFVSRFQQELEGLLSRTAPLTENAANDNRRPR